MNLVFVCDGAVITEEECVKLFKQTAFVYRDESSRVHFEFIQVSYNGYSLSIEREIPMAKMRVIY